MPVNPLPAFLAGLNSTASVERDRNATGAATTSHGYAPRQFVPVPGLGAVACRFVLKGHDTVMVANRPVPVLKWRVLFGVSLALDLTHRFVWADPERPGPPRELYVTAASNTYTSARGMYCAADALEYVVPSPSPPA